MAPGKQYPVESPWRDDLGGSGGAPEPAAPTASERMIDPNLFYCMEKGGHLVDQNPCPVHHTPTTRYSGD